MGHIFNSRRSRRAGAIALSVAATATLAPSAFAATVGAGDKYHVSNPGEDAIAACTINSVHEGADGKRYAMTAGHCASEVPGLKEGEDIVVIDPETGEEYGKFVHYTMEGDILDLHDYALIELDDSVEVRDGVTSTASIGTQVGIPKEWATSPVAPVEHIGTAASGDIVYKDGSTSGRTPGVVLYTDEESTMVLTVALPGDSGGILHDGKGANVGVTSQSMMVLPIAVWQRSDRANEQLAEEGYELQTEVDPYNGPENNPLADAMEWEKDLYERWGIEYPSSASDASVTETVVNVDQQLAQSVEQVNDFQQNPQQAVEENVTSAQQQVQSDIAVVEQQVQNDVATAEQQITEASNQIANDINAGVQQFANQAGVQLPQF